MAERCEEGIHMANLLEEGDHTTPPERRLAMLPLVRHKCLAHMM
jgi:hypothetical protein